MKKNEPHILFYTLETRFNLFDLKLKEKYPLWDILRFNIWRKASGNEHPITFKNTKSRTSIKNLLKTFYSLRIIFFRDFHNLFYTCSRIPNQNNEYFDPYFEKVKDLVPGNWICYETVIGKDNYLKNEIIFDFISYLKILFSFIFKLIALFDNSHSSEISRVVFACNYHYDKKIISEFEIKMLIIHFNFELICYKLLFKYLGLKKIFFYGYSKSLVQAAIDLNIPCYEFQHGDITETTVCYIYPDSVNNIVSPNILFTYSEIWTHNKNIPYRCIPVGSVNNYSVKLKKVAVDNSVVILSSPYQGEYLIKLALQLTIADPSLCIFFKLHPMEFQKYDYYKLCFSDYKMINLLDIKMNIFDVLSLSNDFILIYSTTLYEIIHFNKNAYIFKSPNFFQKGLYIGDVTVPIFDTPESFFIIRNSSNPNLSVKIELFKPFNQELFKLSL
jgi:hypothetical protein